MFRFSLIILFLITVNAPAQMVPFAFIKPATPASCIAGSEVFTTAGAGAFQVPDGCTNLFVEVWGAGGAGGYFESGGDPPLPPPLYCSRAGGGGAGGYAFKSVSVSGGESIPYTVGSRTVATTASGMTAHYGATVPLSQAAGGTGGTATGGTRNLTGNNGKSASGDNGGDGGSTVWALGGSGGTFDSASGENGASPGGGGGGQGYSSGCPQGGEGGSAQVKFTYWSSEGLPDPFDFTGDNIFPFCDVGETNIVTITGLTSPLNIHVDIITNYSTFDDPVKYRINGGSWLVVNHGDTIVIANNQSLQFSLSYFDSEGTVVLRKDNGSGPILDIFYPEAVGICPF